jgi:hypothetical protein
MSVNLSKSPVWIVAVIVGLIVATALVAGYVDRPGTDTQVAAVDGQCGSCPLKGTEDCCKATGTCAEGSCSAKTAAATGTAVMAQTTETEATTATCPMKAAASGCTGGQCQASK